MRRANLYPSGLLLGTAQYSKLDRSWSGGCQCCYTQRPLFQTNALEQPIYWFGFPRSWPRQRHEFKCTWEMIPGGTARGMTGAARQGRARGQFRMPDLESCHHRQLRLIPTETSRGVSPSARHVPLVKGCFRVKGKALRPRVAGGGRGHLSLCGNECSGDGRT